MLEPIAADAFPPISDYAFLSNCRACALVARDGSVEWACFGRFDARPVFARMLDRRLGGWFRVAPVDRARVTRRYLPGTNVVETRFESASGTVTVTDCLTLRDAPDRPGGIEWPPPEDLLLRLVHGVEGEVPVGVEFHPRFDYGLTTPFFTRPEPDVVTAIGSADGLVLQTDLGPLDCSESSAVSTTTVRPGETRFVALSAWPAHRLHLVRLDADDAVARVEETVRYWEQWSSATTFAGPYRDTVVRSLLVLKGLTNAATGAVAAAATTSLPEEIGGQRNWDYRYTWLRDSAAIMGALAGTGHVREAREFGTWLLRTTAGRAEDLQIMYGLGGERLLHEATLDHLSGYEGSRPVRIGNGAWDQFQLDIYGELMEAVWAVTRIGGGPPVREQGLRFLSTVVERAIERFEEPDEGIWEVRGGRAHFVFSKVMCWVAVDRALRLAAERGLGSEELSSRWERARDHMRARIEQEGVDPETGVFTQAFGSPALDAATLQVALRGFLPPTDPRVRATVDAIDRGLVQNGHVYRYRAPDGLAGDEGTFVFCTAWLINCLAMTGRVDEAKARMEQLLGCANDLGLLAEEVDPHTGSQLGNFPQAFSHVGLIAAANHILLAEAGGTTLPQASGHLRRSARDV